MIERPERAQVDDLGLDAVLAGERLGGLERADAHVAVAEDREVLARAGDRRLADRDDRVAIGHLGLEEAVGLLVLEEHRPGPGRGSPP